MTKEEVKALIKAKIEGQGTAIDASSVLPAILNGIMDLIDEGGGGGTSDAVQYIPQELTESQQMQARKNQGLYYEEYNSVTESKSASFYGVDIDGETGQPYSGWFSQNIVPERPTGYWGVGFAPAYFPIKYGVDYTVDSIKVNGREGVLTRGEGWVMAVDPNNEDAIVIIVKNRDGATIETKYGTFEFYEGAFASAELTIYGYEDGGMIYYQGNTNYVVQSSEVTYTYIDNPVSKVPAKFLDIAPNISSSSVTDEQLAGAKETYRQIGLRDTIQVYFAKNPMTGALSTTRKYANLAQHIRDNDVMRPPILGWIRPSNSYQTDGVEDVTINVLFQKASPKSYIRFVFNKFDVYLYSDDTLEVVKTEDLNMTITRDGQNYSCDASYADVVAALNANRTVRVKVIENSQTTAISQAVAFWALGAIIISILPPNTMLYYLADGTITNTLPN